MYDLEKIHPEHRKAMSDIAKSPLFTEAMKLKIYQLYLKLGSVNKRDWVKVANED